MVQAIGGARLNPVAMSDAARDEIAAALARGRARLEALDASDEDIDAAARADLGALPFRDEMFDIAISSHVAEHLTQPERVFGELSRVLKPGGRLLILTPTVTSIFGIFTSRMAMSGFSSRTSASAWSPRPDSPTTS